MFYDGGDDDNNDTKGSITTDPEDKGGPAAGTYDKPDLNVPGGEADAVAEDHQ